MKGGTGFVRSTLYRVNPVTEFPVQLSSGQAQWEAVFDEIQWLRAGGDCQYELSFSRTACSLS